MCHNSFATFRFTVMDIFLYKQLVQVQQAKSLTLSYLYTCLMLIPVELDKSTMGIILCIIMHYRTWTLKIKSTMCIIFASRVSTLVEQLKMCNGTCCYCLFSGWRQTTHTFSRSLSCWFLSILQTHSLQGSWLLSRGVVLATIRMEPIRS